MSAERRLVLDLGILLLLGALVFSVVDLLLVVFKPRVKGRVFSHGAILGSAVLSITSLLILLKYIFDNDFSNQYVLEHSNIALAPELKLSVLWTGQEGSLLLWTTLTIVCFAIYRLFFYRQKSNKLVRRSFIIGSFFCMAFLMLSLTSSPFVSAETVEVDGWGLNPLLRTPWNIVHPPIVFVAYAALLVPFSIALAGMTYILSEEDAIKNQKVMDYLNLQMAFSWIFLTLGIIIGGYWAYITLGWGGYWAWDPVETTSLIAWLLCTGYFHVKTLFKPSGAGTNTLVIFTFLSVLFATFVTRSGIISSVHGFSESLLAQSFIVIMLGSVVGYVTFLGYQLASTRTRVAKGFKEKVLGSRLLFAMFISLVSILGLAVVSLVGVIYPILLSATSGTQFSMEQSFFNNASSPFVIGLLGSIFFCSFPNPRHSRLLLMVIGSGVGLGIVTLIAGLPTESPLANFMLPLTFISLLGAGAKIIRDFRKMSKASIVFKSSSRTILHLGFILILFGVLISSNIQASYVGWVMPCCPVELGNVVVEVDEVTFQVYSYNSYAIEGKILVYDDGVLSGGGNVYHVVEAGWGSYSQLNVFSTFWRDVYVSLHDAQVDPVTGEITNAYLEIKVIPFISLVWAGCILTILAILSMLVVYSIQFVKKYNPPPSIRKTFSARTRSNR